MKRGLIFFLSLFIVFYMPLTASAESTTITVEVPAPSYQLTIPSDMTISYKDTVCTLSVPTVKEASGFKEGMYLTVAISHGGCFTSQTTSATIPFSFQMVTEQGPVLWNSGNSLIFERNENSGVNTNGYISDGIFPSAMQLSISDAAWDAALPGSYKAVITFTADYVLSE